MLDEKINLEPKEYEILDFCFELMAHEFGLSNTRTRLIFKELCTFSKEGQKSFLIKRYQKRIEDKFKITILDDSFCSFREKNNTIFVELWGVYDEKSKTRTKIRKTLTVNSTNKAEHKAVFECYLTLNNLYIIDNDFKYLYYTTKEDKRFLENTKELIM